MASQIEKAGVGGPRGGNLRPEDIKIKKNHNYRDIHSDEAQAHIAWLMESIQLEGVKKPIDVSFSDGEWFLEAGECRLRAAQQLRKQGWDGYIPCFQVKGDEATILAKSLIDNTGLPPTLLEVGKALQQLLDWGWELDRAAKCIPPSITPDPAKALRMAKKALDLNAAPLAVKEAVKKGVDGVKVSASLAVAASKKNPLRAAEIIQEAAQEAKAKGKTVAMRPKGAGVATKLKEATKQQVEEWLRLGDALCLVALDPNLSVDEVESCAKAYRKSRGL